MSEHIEHFDEHTPYEYRCGQCDAYWFEDPPKLCPFCGGDSIDEIWSDENNYGMQELPEDFNP